MGNILVKAIIDQFIEITNRRSKDCKICWDPCDFKIVAREFFDSQLIEVFHKKLHEKLDEKKCCCKLKCREKKDWKNDPEWKKDHGGDDRKHYWKDGDKWKRCRCHSSCPCKSKCRSKEVGKLPIITIEFTGLRFEDLDNKKWICYLDRKAAELLTKIEAKRDKLYPKVCCPSKKCEKKVKCKCECHICRRNRKKIDCKKHSDKSSDKHDPKSDSPTSSDSDKWSEYSGRGSDKCSDKHSDKHSDKDSDKCSDKHSDKHSDKCSDKHSDKHSDCSKDSEKWYSDSSTDSDKSHSDRSSDKCKKFFKCKKCKCRICKRARKFDCKKRHRKPKKSDGHGRPLRTQEGFIEEFGQN